MSNHSTRGKCNKWTSFDASTIHISNMMCAHATVAFKLSPLSFFSSTIYQFFHISYMWFGAVLSFLNHFRLKRILPFEFSRRSNRLLSFYKIIERKMQKIAPITITYSVNYHYLFLIKWETSRSHDLYLTNYALFKRL